jgi:PAS domain S-box-containing protein/diguanylate cyclase (GGDEF)-like protein
MGIRVKVKHILIIFAILLISQAASAKPLNILLLHSYQQEFPVTKKQHEGFIKGLREASYDRQYNIFTEYLNSKTSAAYTEHTDVLDSYIQSKYILNQPDIIYATNDEAVTYLSKTNIGYLRDTPLIITGISKKPDIARSGDTMEILSVHDIKTTIDMINGIRKDKPSIKFIASGSRSTWDMSEAIDIYIRESGTKQKIDVYVSKDLNKLLSEIPTEKDTAYVTANVGGFDNNGRHVTTMEALRKIKDSLDTKYIFCMHDLEIQQGILGGYVTSEKELGIKAGHAAAVMLEKEQTGSSTKYAANSYIFDKQALDKAGINLPEWIKAEAKFINNPPSFINKYGRAMIWVIILLVLMILIASVTFSVYVSDQHKKLQERNHEIEKLSRQNQHYINAVDASNFVSVADKKGRITYINDAYLSALGYETSELIGHDHRKVNHPDMDQQVYKTLLKAVTNGHIWAGVLLNKTKDGKTLYLETSIVPIKDEYGEIFEYLSVRKDISQIIHQQKEIQSQYTDVLTGLPNRVKMRLDRNNSENPAVALLNIDGFSIINTFYGMEAGDYILKAVAAKIKDMLPKGMTVYRVSGDEFGILSWDTADFDSFNTTVQNIVEQISFSTFIYEESEMHFSLTTGTSIGRATTITKAGIALRQARLSKKSFMTYDEAESEMEKIRDTVLYSGSLRYALMNDGIVPYFQPIVSTETKEVVKYEALMRIEESSGNMLPPDKFLFMSKKLKLYNPISLKMIEKTLSILKDTDKSTCINFDLEDVRNEKLQTRFFELINEHDLQGRITVEITESEGMDNLDELSAFLANARRHGCLIAIDDFGTGYSNFMYILSLQPDFLKIDGSITRQIHVSPRAKLLTQTIADMCRQAGIKTVAEYVATEEIYQTVKEIGIDYCQGYLFGIPSEDFEIKL